MEIKALKRETLRQQKNIGEIFMYRHGAYDEFLAAELRSSKEYACGFLLTLMEGDEGLDPVVALKHTIKRYGIKEFSEFSEIPEKSISRMLSSESIPKIETLDKYFAPFGLKVKINLEEVA